MSLRYSLLSWVALLAVGALCAGLAIADDTDESAEDPFGTYVLAGRERYERDPHIAAGTLDLDPEGGQISIRYPETDLGPWSAELVFERELDEDVLDVMERGQSLRRRFTLEGERYGHEIRVHGVLHLRKNSDGAFRVSVRYGGDLIERSQEEDEDAEEADAEVARGDDAANDDDESAAEEDEPREIITVVARFSGGSSGTQSEADDTPR